MDLFTYLMAKNGNNTSVHGDLFSYLLGKGQSQTQTISGVTIYISNAKKLVSFMMTKESTQATSILPSEYTQVDYIESHGTEYIDTNVTGEATWNLKIQYTSIKKTTQILLGRSSSAGYWFGILNTDNNGVYGFGTDNKVDIVGTTLVEAIINTSNTNISGIINNQNITPRNITDFSYLNNNYQLFKATKFSQFLSNCKLFSTKCYQNNILIRDFIPCYRNSDNEVGLYDLVNDVFYTNQGTGAFTYGSVATIPNPDYPIEVKTVKESVDVYVSNGETTNTYTINLGNNELVGIGNYKDELLVDKSGHCWLNKVINKKRILSTDSMTIVGIDNTQGCIDISNFPSKIGGNSYMLCNYLSSTILGATIDNSNKIGFNNLSNANQFRFRLNKGELNLTDTKEWLANHELWVWYVRPTPQLIDLNTTVDLKLFKGVNNVSNSEDGYMTIEYK